MRCGSRYRYGRYGIVRCNYDRSEHDPLHHRATVARSDGSGLSTVWWSTDEQIDGPLPEPLNELAEAIHAWSVGQGFFTPESVSAEASFVSLDDDELYVSDADLVLGKLGLVTSEVAEAMEAVRDGDAENLAEELADTIIRVLQLCGALGIDIDRAVDEKMLKNHRRPRRHGRETSL